MKQVTVYQSDDGARFDTEQECAAHEARAKAVQVLERVEWRGLDRDPDDILCVYEGCLPEFLADNWLAIAAAFEVSK